MNEKMREKMKEYLTNDVKIWFWTEPEKKLGKPGPMMTDSIDQSGQIKFGPAFLGQ